MILGVFIEFFGVQIVIGLSKNHCDLIITVGFDLSQNSRYLSIFYRYISNIYQYFIDISLIFTDILPIFFRKFQHMCALDKVSKFRRNIENFLYFGDFTDFPLIFSSIDYRLPISLWCQPITDFLGIFRPKKQIFLSLLLLTCLGHLIYDMID